MHYVALKSAASNVDIVARAIAIAGVVIALASLVFAWYQWQYSGPRLVIRMETYAHKRKTNLGDVWIFNVDVWNRGRMATFIRIITVVQLRWRWQFSWWFNWWLRIARRDGAIGSSARPFEGQSLKDPEHEFPQEVPPGGYLRARAIITADLFYPHIHWVQAKVTTGDRRSSWSASVRSPNHDRPPRYLRKAMVKDIDDD